MPRLLSVQYRCHPQIASLASALFYGGRLGSGVSAADRPALLPGLPPLAFVDCRGREERAAWGGSVFNQKEAREVVRLARLLVAHGLPGTEVGIICLFRAQVGLIREGLCEAPGGADPDGGEPAALADLTEIDVATVDSFQGQEKKVIVLSTAFTGSGAFTADPHRINVALTRAKHHLVIVGHGEALQNSKLWAKVVRRSADARVGELEAGLAGPSGGGA